MWTGNTSHGPPHMRNADTITMDHAEEAGMSLATYAETRGHLQRGARPLPVWPAARHVPGDTTTAPAPDAVWIGTGDA